MSQVRSVTYVSGPDTFLTNTVPLTRTPDGSQVSEKPPFSAACSSPEGCRRDRPANCHVISLRLIRFSPKAYRPKARQGAKPIAPRGMFFSSCRAVHQQLSSVAQSYPQVQRFLAEGSNGALGKL